MAPVAVATTTIIAIATIVIIIIVVVVVTVVVAAAAAAACERHRLCAFHDGALVNVTLCHPTRRRCVEVDEVPKSLHDGESVPLFFKFEHHPTVLRAPQSRRREPQPHTRHLWVREGGTGGRRWVRMGEERCE
jgi:hypothetical protein